MLRELWVDEGRESELQAVFGPLGIWKVLLGRAQGYIRTELKCESASDRRYRVLDFWWSHVAFEDFRERFAAEIDAFARRMAAAGLVNKELWLGSFYTNESDPDEGIEPTPA